MSISIRLALIYNRAQVIFNKMLCYSLPCLSTLLQLVKTDNGIKVRTDHGEEIMADAVLFATGNAIIFVHDASVHVFGLNLNIY